MGWIIVGLLALLIAVALVALGRIPRRSWEMAAAAVLLGVAGYAWQGNPGLAGSPREPVETVEGIEEDLVKQRDAMGENFGDARAWIVLADAQSRQGKFATAAAALRQGIKSHPDDPDLWLALGNALVGHSAGMLTPAAQFAYQRSANLAPGHPGPPFFMGLALATSGQLAEARAVWAELLARSPADAEWRGDLEQRLARLDSLMMQQGMAPAAPPAATPEAP